MSVDLQDNVYIVTGGSRGFGLAIAKSLVEHGARVGLISRNQSGLDQAVAEIGADHALGVAADVGSRASVSIAFEKIHKHCRRLDALVEYVG